MSLTHFDGILHGIQLWHQYSLSMVDCDREPSQDCQRVLLFRGLGVSAEEEELLTSGILFNFTLQP